MREIERDGPLRQLALFARFGALAGHIGLDD
jgi:hypothetical protein